MLYRLRYWLCTSTIPLYILAISLVVGGTYLAYSHDLNIHETQVSDCKKAGGELKRVGMSGSKVIHRCIDDFGREMPY